MSTTADTALHSFVVFAPDYADDGALQRRLAVREQHVGGVKGLHDSGLLTIGGALLTPESVERADATRKMVGSMLVVQATSIAEVKAKIEADIYWTSGVWDKERLLIMPFAQVSFAK